MNDLQLKRNIKRIPRLQFHIKRCSKQPDRVAGFKDELTRRKFEMKAAGKDDLLKDLLAIKLTPFKDKAAEDLDAIMKRELPG